MAIMEFINIGNTDTTCLNSYRASGTGEAKASLLFLSDLKSS